MVIFDVFIYIYIYRTESTFRNSAPIQRTESNASQQSKNQFDPFCSFRGSTVSASVNTASWKLALPSFLEKSCICPLGRTISKLLTSQVSQSWAATARDKPWKTGCYWSAALLYTLQTLQNYLSSTWDFQGFGILWNSLRMPQKADSPWPVEQGALEIHHAKYAKRCHLTQQVATAAAATSAAEICRDLR